MGSSIRSPSGFRLGPILSYNPRKSRQSHVTAHICPTFVAADEPTLLSANRVVHTESITLHHLEQNYLHLRPVEHNNCVSNFLYTHNEIKRFSNLIHFAQVKVQVLNNLLTDFCVNNPTCGGYQPAVEPVVPFNLAARSPLHGHGLTP